MASLWKEADGNRRVRIVPDNLDDPGLSDGSKALLAYCRCGGLSGTLQAQCCRNDGLQFQRMPSGDATRWLDQFALTDPTKPVPAGSPGR